jgi:cyclic pyranopterin phosphate synthase
VSRSAQRGDEQGSARTLRVIQDRCGRRVDYLRLSVTPTCGMRCVYCRPTASSLPRASELLSVDEIDWLVRQLAQRYGVRKVRLTGGEPTLRSELVEIVARLAAIPELAMVTLTTNGLSLADQAEALARAGLRRVNVSLDALDPQQFARLTGVDGVSRVLAGIDAAVAAGLNPVRLNTVVLRGLNDGELPSLLEYAGRRKVELRFIELMHMEPASPDLAQRYLSNAEVRLRLSEVVTRWQPSDRQYGTAERYCAQLKDGTQVEVGFINPRSRPFCDQCNRLRIAADGAIYPCLMDHPTSSVLTALRPVRDGVLLDRLLADGLSRKQVQHSGHGVAAMSEIGG